MRGKNSMNRCREMVMIILRASRIGERVYEMKRSFPDKPTPVGTRISVNSANT